MCYKVTAITLMSLFLTLNDLKLIALEQISCIFSDDFIHEPEEISGHWVKFLWYVLKTFIVLLTLWALWPSNAKYTRRNKKIKNIYHSTYLHRVYRGERQ